MAKTRAPEYHPYAFSLPHQHHMRMVDPRDDTRIMLVRSNADVSDYEVREDRYGVGRGRLLRIDCDTGRPLGIVRR